MDDKPNLKRLEQENERLRGELDQLQLAYEETQQFFRGILNSVRDVLFYKDVRGVYRNCNPAFAQFYGLNTTEIIGKTDYDLCPPELAELFNERDRQVLESRQTIVYVDESELPNGQLLSMETSKSPIIDSDDKLIGVVGISRDITEKKQAATALQQSEEKYRNLIQHSGDAIYLFFNHRFEVVNERFRQLFKITDAELKAPGFNEMKLVAPQSRDELRAYLKSLPRQDQTTKYEFTALTTEGDEVQVEVDITYLKYKDGIATQGIIRDITERKLLEAQLRQAQKMEAVGQLAGGVAHDFNNLLTVINGYCDLLSSQNLAPKLREPIEQIHQAGERASRMTSQLLAFSRKQISQPQILDLNSLINDQSKMLRRLLGEDIEIREQLASDLKPVFIDPGQMEQIIMNIAVNARDAMPLGGILSLETSSFEFDDAYLRIHRECKPGSYIQLAISDNGVGMDAETASHIFEPFFTTKGLEKGTGLGLATVYGIVKQNEGYIYVYSEGGLGTTFKIYLPQAGEQAEERERRPVDAGNLKGDATILLVEDDDEVRRITQSSLASFGYEVLAAANGDEALAIFEKQGGVDLLLTDVVMPHMSGPDVAHKLSALKQNLRILYFSGYTDDAIVRHGILESGLEFIQKPFTRIGLAEKVKEVLEKEQ